jgi:hypothetical protein
MWDFISSKKEICFKNCIVEETVDVNCVLALLHSVGVGDIADI